MKSFAVSALAVYATACTDPDAPRLESVEPDEAPPGTEIVIRGENLCGTEVAVTEWSECDPLPVGSVSFGVDPQVSAIVSSWSDVTIEAIVPAAASGEVLIVVTVDGRSSNGISFTVR